MKFGYGSYVPYKNGYRGSIYIGATRIREVHPTVKAVRQWLDLMGKKKLALEGGAPELADRDAKVTYKEITAALLEHYKAGIERVHTERVLESYAGELKRLEEWWGDRRIAHTRIADVDVWVRHLRIKRKLATSTIRHHLDRLSAVHQFAVRLGKLAKEPCKVARPRLVVMTKRSPVADTDLAKLIQAARLSYDRRVLAVILLAADAGLRREEIQRLRGDDVLLEEGYLRLAVRDESSDRPKNAKERRIPILTERLKKALDDLPRDPGKSLLQIASDSGVQGMATRAWQVVFGKGSRAQLHRLRHAFANRADRAGFSGAEIMAMMGHQHLSTTEGYLHPDLSGITQERRLAFESWATNGPRVAQTETESS